MSCSGQDVEDRIYTGAEQTDKYIDLLKDKTVGLVVNHTSYINKTHLVDTLLSLNVDVIKIFSPEHGFLGNYHDGATVKNSKYFSLDVISLYGKKKKPSETDLRGVDILVFDIQDVGVRFYTYLSTLHFIMEAAAENGIEVLVLDRPNPNSFYIDGPVLEGDYSSFVGLHPVPLVYGLTIGEYALMINGEKWLKEKVSCSLKIIPCRNYTHSSRYQLPIPPSPNLKSMRAVYLYPSLALFEGTNISVGRGTDFPFETYGHPKFPETDFSFIPQSIKGASLNPKHLGALCYGIDLRKLHVDSLKANIKTIDLGYLRSAYDLLDSSIFEFTNYFNNLAGNGVLQKQVAKGIREDAIRKSWQKDLEEYKTIRSKYLIYPE